MAQDALKKPTEHVGEYLKPNYDVGKRSITYNDITLRQVTRAYDVAPPDTSIMR